MKKIVIIIFSLITSILLIPKVNASNVFVAGTSYYFTGYTLNGNRYSDKFSLHYVDNNLTYCLEPGVKLGSDYKVLEDFNIPYESKLKILLAAHYGYLYKNRNDIRFGLATQNIIWREITGKDTIFSTELWGEGNIVDLTYYENLINDSINTHMKTPNVITNDEIIIGKKTTFEDLNNVISLYDLTPYTDEKIINNTINISFDTSGYKTIKLEKNKDYNYNYKVYGDSNYQKLLMPGNIPELNYEFTIYVNPININFKIIDSLTLEEIDTVSLDIDEKIISNKETFILDTYHPINVSIKEVPKEYILNNDIYKYDTFTKKNCTITIPIDPIYNDYKIYKTYDEIYPEENAIFELINNDNKKTEGVYLTDNEGTFELHLKYGNYTLNQIKGIEGYELISYSLENTKPQIQKSNIIKLNDKKILNNNDEVDIVDEQIAQNLVLTGNNISLLYIVFIFPLLCLLRKK